MLCSFYFMFFFKQKTAYEMRISDWSSDVCSSDLQHDQLARSTQLARRRQEVLRTPELFDYHRDDGCVRVFREPIDVILDAACRFVARGDRIDRKSVV